MARKTHSPMKFHQFLVSRDIGGAGLVALDFAKILCAQGIESPVWIPGTGPAWTQAEGRGLQVESYDLASASSRSNIKAAGVNWQVWSRLRKTGPGLVHVHSPHAYGALRRGLGYSGLKQVVHVQIEEEQEGLRWALKSPPDLIITCAQFLVDQVRQALPEHRRDRQRIAAVPNAVDTAKYFPADKREAKRKVGAPFALPMCLMLANLAPHKGQETAIRTAALLKARGITVHFWLAGTERGGSGAYTERLHALIAELGVADRVCLLGQRGDAPDLLRAADFFLLPSTCEGLPLSILEAQATKVPVLAAPTAGIPEVICDGTTGFLIPAGDAAGYAGQLETLLANPSLADRVAEAAFLHTTREHNWTAYCRHVVELYEEVLESRPSPAPARSIAQFRVGPLKSLRRPLRDGLFSVFRRVLATDDGRSMVTDAVRGLLDARLPEIQTDDGTADPPYSDLGAARLAGQTSRRTNMIFITARFRSGSTLLWNLFRNIKGCTAYYEPLNERRWFDPATRGERTDTTHRNVCDYWKEYDGLGELGGYYKEEWIRRHLLMDENCWDPGLKRYVEILIEKAPGRPVLQFNRIDFRLPWFRRNFPGAKLVHLYRHPRDQWCSSLLDVKCFPRHGRVEDFVPHDKFYLLSWANDLKYHFPFLDPRAAAHPYQIFYYIWKLSYLFGRRYADHSLAFEHLVGNPVGELEKLLDVLNVPGGDVTALVKLLAAPSLGKWQEYADDSWFRDHETICETTLADFFAGGGTAETSPDLLKRNGVEHARLGNGSARRKAS